MAKNHTVKFVPSGRGKAQCPPDARFPEGYDHRNASGFGCIVELPYPAPECGAYVVQCLRCDSNMAITSVGRPDDPKSCQLICKFNGAANV